MDILMWIGLMISLPFIFMIGTAIKGILYLFFGLIYVWVLYTLYIFGPIRIVYTIVALIKIISGTGSFKQLLLSFLIPEYLIIKYFKNKNK